MDRCKLVAIGEIKNEEKGKNIAHRGGTPPFGNRVVAYMKKELHRHHENAGTALELFYGVVKETVTSWSPIPVE